MIHVADTIDGIGFEVWIPDGAQRTRAAPHEVGYRFACGKDTLSIAIAIAIIEPLEREVARWRGAGDLVLRASTLADGHLVTVLGDRQLMAIRHVHLLRRWTALCCRVQLGLRRRAAWQRQAWVEAICASLLLAR